MAGKKPDKRGELAPKQTRFIEEYLVDFNATQAAIRAGYSARTANEQAARMLAKASISNEIANRQEARAKRLEVTVDRIELELARIAFSDMRKYAQWGPTKAAQESQARADRANAVAEDDEDLVSPAGVMLLSSEALTEDEAAAVKEVSETATPHGIKYGLKLHEKLRALKLLGMRRGMWKGEKSGPSKVNWVQIAINAQSKR